VHALKGVVFYMIPLERDGAGEELREIGEDTGEAVGSAILEEQMMCALVDHDEEGMIGKCAQQIGCAEDDPPGGISYQPSEDDLEQYEAEDGKERVFVLPDKLSDLRMLLQYLFGTEPVGLLLSGIHKICSL